MACGSQRRARSPADEDLSDLERGRLPGPWQEADGNTAALTPLQSILTMLTMADTALNSPVLVKA